MLIGIFILKFQGYKSGLGWLYKLVPTCGLQVSEMQPSFVPLLEGSAIGTAATSMKGGNCIICLSLLLKYYIPSTHLLLLRCFCFCKMFLRDFCYLLPNTVTVFPCTKNPRGQMSVQSNSLALPQAHTALCKTVPIPLPLWKCADARQRSLWPAGYGFLSSGSTHVASFPAEWVCSEGKSAYSALQCSWHSADRLFAEPGAPLSLGQCYWNHQL